MESGRDMAVPGRGLVASARESDWPDFAEVLETKLEAAVASAAGSDCRTGRRKDSRTLSCTGSPLNAAHSEPWTTLTSV